MFCENCGNEISNDTRFCPLCGAQVKSAAAPAGKISSVETTAPVGTGEIQSAQGFQKMNQGYQGIESKEDIKGQKVTENIYLCPDGAYRWVYEFDMIKNPTILITVWKVLLMSCAIVMILVMFFRIMDGDFFNLPDPDDLAEYIGGLVLVMLFMAFLSVVAYLIVAKSYGFRYMVLFTMNENEIEHRQMKNQFDKAKAMGWLTAAAGLAAGSLGRAGTGMLAATKTASTSVYDHVKKVKSDRRHNVIYVNETLDHNQIYVDEADFDFVRNFLIEHCRNAKQVS
ncbi:zinc-ribbon domain-containing protein [Oribacterium sp. KHPX15]|uniref:zinc ribbon domain-containing protein n=1 Tax=Oribacterium sp. KHPX15 TaxID=1855342 RepID=UPI00089D5A1A|nr:zinc ribbon domain-containing protein [Oribacterium sp. KHPX15]SEA90351.1 zinc-ribbon domain-containing protein [Oribacterium sp. KHPX15]